MPIVALTCLDGHLAEQYVHTASDVGCEARVCHCGQTFAPALSVGRGLTYFEEGRARTIHNLGHEPVTIRSHREHEAAMKKAGVTWATNGTGRKGCWQ